MGILDLKDEFLSEEIRALIDDAHNFLELKEEMQTGWQSMFLPLTSNN